MEGHNLKQQTDSDRCIALNIASLVCGVLGNIFLLFNFTKAVRYIIALPMTIILWYFSTGILTGILFSMNKYTPPGEHQVYSQGFWHAVIASCLYLFSSMILMVNMLGYFLGHYPQHFALSDDQRNLILQTMMFFVWLAGGAAVFADVNGWSFCDSLYFADVTILTVGFGDFAPTNDVARGLVFPYSVGGIIILGLMVSSIHRFANDLSRDNVIKKHVERRRILTVGRVVTTEEEMQQKQEDLERQLDLRPGHRPTISGPFAPGTEPENRVNTIGFDDNEPKPSQFMKSSHHKGPLHATLKAMGAPHRRLRRARTKMPKLLLMKEEKDRFDAMRKIQAQTSTFKRWYALTLSVTAFGILWCLGAVAFWQAEATTQHLSYFEALYFCYVSLLTIGYGDLSPKSNAGKPFFIVWSLIAVPTMTILISDMGDTVVASFRRGTFRLADWTIMPKKGIYRQLLIRNPWLLNWMRRKAARQRIKAGFQVAEENQTPTLEELAAQDQLSEAELSRRLAFSIRKTADDLQNGNNQRYTYEEWVEFTRLIKFTTESIDDLEYNEEEHGVVDWDWIGESSPMLSDQSETEWVLDRLCESLVRYLSKNQAPGKVDEYPKHKEEKAGGRQDGLVNYPDVDRPIEFNAPTFKSEQDEPPKKNSLEDSGQPSPGPPPSDDVEPRPQYASLSTETATRDFRRPMEGEIDRRGSHQSNWSKRGERRKSSIVAAAAASPHTSSTARKGPFARIHGHSGRGGVGNRRRSSGISSGANNEGFRTLKSRLLHRNTGGY